MELFVIKTSMKSDVIPLKTTDYDAVFGGDRNDCVCISINPYRGPGRVVVRGHDDVDSVTLCVNICCNGNFINSYQYRNESQIDCLVGVVCHEADPLPSSPDVRST